MREVKCSDITDAVEKAYIRSAIFLPPDIAIQLECAWESEETNAAREALGDIYADFNHAATTRVPLCKDIGTAVIFADIGQDIHITGGSFEDAVTEGVRKGYEAAKSEPLMGVSAGENTVIHIRLIPDDKLKITVAPDDFTSFKAMEIFTSSVKSKEIEDFIVETVLRAEDKSSAPWIVGVGLGGTVEKCAILAKRALYRPIDVRNPKYEDMERRILDKINELGIGPRGLGGITSALAVNLEEAHTTAMPCIVYMGCHFTCRASIEL